MKKLSILLAIALTSLISLARPIRGADIGAKYIALQDCGSDGIPVLRITPTATTAHYSPFNTGETFTSNGDWVVVAKMRIVPGSSIGTWGTMLGTVGGNRNDGINLRQYNGLNDFAVYCGGLNTYRVSGYGLDATDWVEVEISLKGVYFDEYLDSNSRFMNPQAYTSSIPLYIGEGPRGFGATCATDWQWIQIWRDGELCREFIPVPMGCFYDTVSGTLLQKDNRSSTRVEYFEEDFE